MFRERHLYRDMTRVCRRVACIAWCQKRDIIETGGLREAIDNETDVTMET